MLYTMKYCEVMSCIQPPLRFKTGPCDLKQEALITWPPRHFLYIVFLSALQIKTDIFANSVDLDELQRLRYGNFHIIPQINP